MSGRVLSAGSSDAAAQRVAELLESLVSRLQAGESVDVEAFLAEHPAEAEQLRPLLPAVQALAEVSQSGADGMGPGQGDGPPLGTLGDFRLVRELGRGGMGSSTRRSKSRCDRRVALKVLPFAATMDPRHLQRFQNEAQAAACLHHTNIVPVYAVGSERGVHFYAMQFIDGCTLADAIRDCGGRQHSSAGAAGGEAEADDAVAPTTAHVPADRSPTRRRTRRRQPGNRRWSLPAARNTSARWRSWAFRPRRRWTTPIRSASSIATSSRATCCWTRPAACG